MSRKTVSVLLIEQDRNNASYVRRLVAETGDTCSLRVAESVMAALDLIQSNEVDIVLLGIGLPRGSALLDTLRNVRTKLSESIPILVINDHDDQQEALDALQSGAQDHLIKGEFDGRSLLRSMLYAIERQKTRAELCKTCAEIEQTKESLRQSERKFRAVFDQAFQMTGLLSPDGTVMQANRTALDFIGISEADVLGKPLWEAPWLEHSKAQQEKVHSAVKNAADGAFVRFEADLLTLDGKVRHFDCSLTPVTDESGRVVLIIPEARDITERIVAEKALWESTQMFKLVLDNMPAFVFWKDRNSVYLGCNYLFAANAGLKSVEEIVGKTDLDLPWKNTEAESYRADDRAVMESGIPKVNYEETQCKADGQITAVRTSKIPLRNAEGEVIGVLGTFEDITERKLAEEALKEERMLFIAGPVVAFKWKAAEGWPAEYVSPNIFEQFGYRAEDLTSGRILYADIIHPDDLPRLTSEVNAYCAAKVPCYEQEYRIARADGQYRWVYDFTVVIRDSGGAVTHFHGHLSDITDRKRAEEEQARLRQHLHQAQKMEAVGHLAGGIAHDFNNILGIINGYSELLLQDPQLQKESRDYVDEILTAGERAASLTRQLLAFSRKLVLTPKVLSLNAVIGGLDKMLRRLIGEEIEVRTLLAPDLDFVKADPGQMEQVLLNFCINARDAMPEGGSITIETTNVEVDEATAAEHFNMTPGRYVRVVVTDTGTGMDEHTLSHVFEPFFTTKGPERGSGLGLATVYGIVKQSGGHVWASSAPGKGSKFFVCLPTVTQETETHYKEEPSQQALRGSETILLVEDAAPLRALFRKHLEDNGYSILEAEDGERAIQISDSFEGSIPLLLTDVSLPKIRGSALGRLLQQRRPGIRVLFVSGYTDTAITPEGEMQVGTAFLQKPFTAEALVRKIRELLDSRPNVMDKGSSNESSDHPRLVS